MADADADSDALHSFRYISPAADVDKFMLALYALQLRLYLPSSHFMIISAA